MTDRPLTNQANLGLVMAAWLAHDTYDHDPVDAPQDDNPIVSATTLLKPTKALVLGHRVPPEDNAIDLQDLVAARMGQSIHSGIESAIFSDARDQILRKIGTAQHIIDNLVINPKKKLLEQNPSAVPLYLEQRRFRMITATNGTKVWISGQFDQVFAGRVEDNKTTSTYKWMKMDQSEKSDFAIQLSIYRWLDPEVITSEVGIINFIFKDWKRGEASRIDNYPPFPVSELPVQLMSLEETERFIIKKIDEILATVPMKHESDMPRCKEEELWKQPDVHKYYKNPETAQKNGRATKNFDSYPAAMQHKAKAGGVGVIKTFPGEVRRCSYCDAAPLCTQRLEYQTD
ncbi:hypothetical protein [uncultured Kiloniella sp.]|uniref:hypothetical protein n=1 Tax=uncultured Kiloniella sp. TaxID=1133091 RepID=UPI002634D557|nr:hypothetical protein [uncultured Kiloniella sp.]